MSNKDLALHFGLLAKLMELHQENPFKIRSYKSVASYLSKLGDPVASMDEQALLELKGVGKAIADKIQQLIRTGKMSTLERYREMTPPGLVELLGLKGIGASKVRSVWKELGVESPGELQYACEENRLVDLKGFGAKTQADILEKLHFHQQNKGQLLHWRALEVATQLEDLLASLVEIEHHERTGSLRRKDPVIAAWDYVVVAESGDLAERLRQHNDVSALSDMGSAFHFKYKGQYPVTLNLSSPESREHRLLETTLSAGAVADGLDPAAIPPHMYELAALKSAALEDVVTHADLRGVLHVHSTYSDGVDSVEDLAKYAISKGYEYLGITDHSQIAVYANGLNINRLEQQWLEIDRLNVELAPFRILKGIECDILSNGDLDYDAALRARFDFIIASIHTNIKMDISKATERIVRAINNPQTTMIGHLTGRLLLGREGYPLEMETVLDALATKNVGIELNVSPSRMDLDWTWLVPAQERGIKIAVNPDAHAKEAIDYLEYGVEVAQKGWLEKANCLNVWSADDFVKFAKKG